MSSSMHDVTMVVMVNIIAGIVIVIFMLALNSTVAIGTLNGILFYANVIATNIFTQSNYHACIMV